MAAGGGGTSAWGTSVERHGVSQNVRSGEIERHGAGARRGSRAVLRRSVGVVWIQRAWAARLVFFSGCGCRVWCDEVLIIGGRTVRCWFDGCDRLDQPPSPFFYISGDVWCAVSDCSDDNVQTNYSALTIKHSELDRNDLKPPTTSRPMCFRSCVSIVCTCFLSLSSSLRVVGITFG